METFEYFLHDDRFDVPATLTVVVADMKRARERAEMLLSSSVHHRGVAVCRGSRELFNLGDCERRPARAVARPDGTSALGYLRSVVAQLLDPVRRRGWALSLDNR
jgi:hypothetical protein